MVYVIGDIHLRSEEPFFTVTKEFLTDTLNMANEKDVLIFTGDFFHRSRPYSEELKVARDFFEKAKQKQVSIIILAGNHEYFRDHGTWAEDVFSEYDIDFIEWPNLHLVYGIQIMFMPWMPLRHILNFSSAKDIKEYYEGVIQKNIEKVDVTKPLYLIYHFEDESVFLGGNDIGVDLSIFEKKYGKNVIRLGGHIHNPSKNYIGTPYSTRSDEAGFDRHIIKIDPFTQEYEFIPTKNEIEYQTMMYEEMINRNYNKNKKYILKVLNAPSFDSIKTFIDSYDNLWLDDYELKFNEDRQIIQEKTSELESIKDFLEMYIKQNKVDSSTANYLLSIF